MVRGRRAAGRPGCSRRLDLVDARAVGPARRDPHAILSPDPELQQRQLNLADWSQTAEAGRRNRIAAALTAVAVVLSSAASLLGLAPHG